MKITTGKKARPRNVLLYGEHGSGKTTLAATFPNPVIIDVEGGSDDIDVARTDRVLDYAAYQAALSWLVTAEHDFKTAITDSIDWLEALVWQHVAQANGEKSIEGIGYGKGYKFAAECFDHLVSGYRLSSAMKCFSSVARRSLGRKTSDSIANARSQSRTQNES